jgi:hypothetical protein
MQDRHTRFAGTPDGIAVAQRAYCAARGKEPADIGEPPRRIRGRRPNCKRTTSSPLTSRISRPGNLRGRRRSR